MILILVLISPEVLFSSHKLERYEYRQIVMGVPFVLTLYAESEAVANKTQTSVYKRLRELNLIFSDYDPDSELSILCKNARPNQEIPISDELASVFDKSLKLSQESSGAFDITVGPYVKMWRRAKRKKMMPTSKMLSAARQKVGYQFIKLNKKEKTVQLNRQRMQIDLGGIAKGYACDEALKICRQNKISSALINAGGDIVAGDSPPGTAGWRIGIASLAKPDEVPTEFLILNNCAVATSGDAYQFVEFNGKRYSHIVNPQTGIGLTKKLSVTVIAPNGTEADSLASAVSVLGPQKGIDLINKKKDFEALVAELLNNEIKIHYSGSFHCFTEKSNISK
jgi:FAD:protein FMN transferase